MTEPVPDQQADSWRLSLTEEVAEVSFEEHDRAEGSQL